MKVISQEFEPENLSSLIATVKQLATDSTKSRSKKDRKEQRSSFRDILRGVEEGDPPNEKVKFGQEILYIDSWYKKLQYDWFCKVKSKENLLFKLSKKHHPHRYLGLGFRNEFTFEFQLHVERNIRTTTSSASV